MLLISGYLMRAPTRAAPIRFHADGIWIFSRDSRPLEPPVHLQVLLSGKTAHPIANLSLRATWRLGPCRVAPASFNSNFPLALRAIPRDRYAAKFPSPRERRGC
jgi:hypothetical protein